MADGPHYHNGLISLKNQDGSHYNLKRALAFWSELNHIEEETVDPVSYALHDFLFIANNYPNVLYPTHWLFLEQIKSVSYLFDIELLSAERLPYLMIELGSRSDKETIQYIHGLLAALLVPYSIILVLMDDLCAISLCDYSDMSRPFVFVSETYQLDLLYENLCEYLDLGNISISDAETYFYDFIAAMYEANNANEDPEYTNEEEQKDSFSDEYERHRNEIKKYYSEEYPDEYIDDLAQTTHSYDLTDYAFDDLEDDDQDDAPEELYGRHSVENEHLDSDEIDEYNFENLDKDLMDDPARLLDWIEKNT